MKLKDYFDSEVKEFSLYDCASSIPDGRDGFKTVNRKIIHGIINGYGENKETLQVSRLVGIVSSKSQYHHGECIEGSTLICLPDGSKTRIDQIKENTVVKSFITGRKIYTESESFNPRFTKETNEWIKITLENDESFTVTYNHPFLTENFEWKSAEEILNNPFIKLVSVKNNETNLMKIKKVKFNLNKNDIRKFYDISVVETECFAIGNSEIIVHNSSAEKAVVKMAQNYTGSNNINLLIPDGQFGNKLNPVSGASRYIRTALSKNFRNFFLKDDDIILEYQTSEDDGEFIEPEVYFPILPFLLINGSEGIGTGFASFVMSYNPKDIKKGIKDILEKKKISKLIPYFEGFKGSVERKKLKEEDTVETVIIKGKITKESATSLRISELPVGTYLENYKEFLHKLEDSGIIKDYEDNSNENEFNFLIKTSKEIASLPEEQLLEKFKLISREKENLTFWISRKKLRKFKTVEDYLKWWTEWRLTVYEKRRLKKIEILEKELSFNKEKIRFIEYYIENSKTFSKKKKSDIETILLKNSFSKENIDIFLSIRIYNLTLDSIEKLKEEITEIEKSLKFYKKNSNSDLFFLDLEKI